MTGTRCLCGPVCLLLLATAGQAAAQEIDASVALANSYDDGWERAWIENLRAIHERTTLGGGAVAKVDGFVVHLGDSISYANQYGWINRFGAIGLQATIAWSKGGGPDVDGAPDNKNGWQLARFDHPAGGRSYTAVSSITVDQYLYGGQRMFAAGSCDTAPLDTLLANTRTDPYPRCPADPEGYRVAVVHDAMLAIVMLGTNDLLLGGRPPGAVRSDLATIVDKLVAKQIMPVLSTVPPAVGLTAEVEALNAEVRTLAENRALPLIDFWGEIMRRQPGTAWQGTLISGDGVHPTEAQHGSYQDPTLHPEYLSVSGYTLRGFLSVCKLAEVKEKVIDGYRPPDAGVLEDVAAADIDPGDTTSWDRGTVYDLGVQDHRPDAELEPDRRSPSDRVRADAVGAVDLASVDDVGAVDAPLEEAGPVDIQVAGGDPSIAIRNGCACGGAGNASSPAALFLVVVLVGRSRRSTRLPYE